MLFRSQVGRSLLVDSDGKLEVNNSDIEVNTDTLETLIGSTNTHLDGFAGAGNNNIGEGSTKLQIYNYGRDVAAGNFKPMVVNSSAEQIVALSSTDNAVLDSIAADGDAIQTKLDTIETTNNAIQAAVEGTLTVGSHPVTNAGTFAVQVSSMPSTVVSGTVTANLSATDNAVLDAMVVDLAALEVLQTSTNSLITTLDGVQDSALTKLGEIETTNNAIQAAVEGTLTVGSHAVTNAGTFAVQVSSVPTTTVQGTITANLSATDNAVLDSAVTKLTEIDSVLDTIKTDTAAQLVKLGTIDADTGSILTSVDGIEALLSTAVTRTSVNETTSRNLATEGSISQYTFDVGTSATFIKFYLSLGLNFPADGDMRVQVSVDNSNWIHERLLVGTDFIDASDYYMTVIELTNPPRYVRLYNNNGSAVITIVDGIIEHGRN